MHSSLCQLSQNRALGRKKEIKMFNVVVHCGRMKSGRVFHALPRTDDVISITFADDGKHIWAKVTKVGHEEIATPNVTGNSDVAFAIHIWIEAISDLTL